MELSFKRQFGFTLIELLVVMSIIALLLALATPRYFSSLDHAKEVALKTNLKVMRDCLDRYKAGRGRGPESLIALVEMRCMRVVPEDSMAPDGDGWVLIPHPDGVTPGIYDIRSSSAAVASDGTKFADW